MTISRPDMQALRDMCEGKLSAMAATKEHLANNVQLLKHPIEEIPICGFKWWEDSEQYECLMDKGHKITKHGQRGMVRRVDD